MSAPHPGRQSPEPERQTGNQQQATPSNGKGINDTVSNKEQSKADLEKLASNPKGPLDDHAKEMTNKTTAHSENAFQA